MGRRSSSPSGLAGLGRAADLAGRSIPDKGGYAGVGSGDLPRFVGIGLLASGRWPMSVRRLRVRRHPGMPRQQPVPVLWIVGGLVLQLILLRPLGFAIASGLLFACTAAAFGKRNLALTIPIGVALCAADLWRLRPASEAEPCRPGFLETLIFGG